MAPAALPTKLLLQAYASGIFPMSDSATDPEVFWVDPERRGIIPLAEFHISRSLARKLRKDDFTISLNHDFSAVLDACAARPDTWINPTIRELYTRLHDEGFAHSLEVWRDKKLAGGVYGVTLGAAFFGESMFSAERDGSKIALAYLVDHLDRTGFTLFDTQFLTPHLASLGAIEISREEYHDRLAAALQSHADITACAGFPTGQELVQRRTHRS